MAEEVKATETTAEPIAAPKADVNVEDLEARNAALEAERAGLIEKASNYQVAYLKERSKNRDEGEDEEEKINRIVEEKLANSRLAEINRELEANNKKALKELKELKIAVANKTDIPVSTTSHSEGQPVKDTLVTPDQMAAFKAMGWSDKDIERYKKNLIRYGGR